MLRRIKFDAAPRKGKPLKFGPHLSFTDFPGRRDQPTPGQVLKTAIVVSGNEAVGRAWYRTPNAMFGGRTPQRATVEGDASLVIGVLHSVAGV